MMLLVMGVSGSGKSTVGQALADAVGGIFLDADSYHPPANIDRMRRGIALTDDDRLPWLEILRDELHRREKTGQTVILACSALKQSYRDLLASRIVTPRWIYLEGTPEQIRDRMQARRGHFMPVALLDSQFQTLEAPTDAIRVPYDLPVGDQVFLIRKTLGI